MGSTTDVLISNQKSFNKLRKRSHIVNNMSLMQERLKYFNEALDVKI